MRILALGLGLIAAAHARPLTFSEQLAFYGPSPVTAPRPLPTVLDANETLKAAAERAGIFIGAAINYAGMNQNSQGPNYPAIALQQFSIFTAENEVRVSQAVLTVGRPLHSRSSQSHPACPPLHSTPPHLLHAPSSARWAPSTLSQTRTRTTSATTSPAQPSQTAQPCASITRWVGGWREWVGGVGEWGRWARARVSRALLVLELGVSRASTIHSPTFPPSTPHSTPSHTPLQPLPHPTLTPTTVLALRKPTMAQRHHPGG
jgi:hypothetical protein